MANGKTIVEQSKEVEQLDRQLAQLQEKRQKAADKLAEMAKEPTTPSKPSRRGRRSGSAGGGRKSGGGLKGILTSKVLPENTEDALSIDDIVTGAKKSGWETKAQDPKVNVNQALGSLKKDGLVETPERGKYRLSKAGVDAKAEAEKAEKESKDESQNG